MKLLDQKNPYGFPLKAPPLIFDVEIGGKVYVRVKSTYEEVSFCDMVDEHNAGGQPGSEPA